jgi:ferredoxin
MDHIGVEVDSDLCAGSTWCLNVAPGAFALDASGKAGLIEDVSATREQLIEAEESCPVGAIRVSLGADEKQE